MSGKLGVEMDSFARDSGATGSELPQSDIPVPNLPAPEAPFDLNGDECPVNFDQHGNHLRGICPRGD